MKTKKCPHCEKVEAFKLKNEICDKCTNKLMRYFIMQTDIQRKERKKVKEKQRLKEAKLKEQAKNLKWGVKVGSKRKKNGNEISKDLFSQPEKKTK